MTVIKILFAIFTQLLLAAAQNAFPTNATIAPATTTELLLQYGSSNSSDTSEYSIDFALDVSFGRRSPADVLQKVFVNSNITRVTPYNLATLTNGSIAYISCDPDVYSGQNLRLSDVIQTAARTLATQNSQGAIILYSTYSSWCNYSETGGYSYLYTFVLPGQNYSRNLSTLLSNNSNVTHYGSIGPITVVDANGNPIGSGNNPPNDSNTPASATMAMIILYSVTGIITVCFVAVIVSGALRARRHPERYGLLNLPGNAHQRRARGIARAMLDTIPIVKFGEKEPKKATSDVEQGTEMPVIVEPDENGKDAQKAMSVDSEDASSHERADSSAGHSHDARHSHDADAPHEKEGQENAGDDGLACSVCTEDFVKGQDLRVLPCNHRYHPECIDPWLLNVSGTCPLCRVDLRNPQAGGEPAENTAADPIPSEAQDLTAQPSVIPQQPPWFSSFLNRHRMRESTPQQRLRALRALRNLREVPN